jgi:hypothetical protein
MGRSFTRAARAATAVAATAALVLLSGKPGCGADLSQQGLTPAAFSRIPPPGWLGEYRKAWVAEHSVYQSRCRTFEVGDELHLLNRLIAYDEYLLHMIGDGSGGDPETPQQLKSAKAMTERLRADLDAADDFVALLEILPTCADTAKTPEPPLPIVTTTAGAETPPASPSSLDTVDLSPASSHLVIGFDERIPALTPSGIRAFGRSAKRWTRSAPARRLS